MSKRARRAKKLKPQQLASGDAQIHLSNPVSDHFQAFIVGNALRWEALAHDELIRRAPKVAYGLEPFYGFLGFWESRNVDEYARWARFREVLDEHCEERFVAVENAGQGKPLVICGAGPSLADHAADYVGMGEQVWGCNSALTWLHSHGHPVTHGFTVDQTPAMLEEWAETPDVEHLIASTVHPHLTEYLLSQGRRIRFFHNYVGLKHEPVTIGGESMMYEDWLYSVLYAATVRVGSGLNSVNRALDLALWQGFDPIYILGADCALRCASPPPDAPVGSKEHRAWLETETVMHADGGHALSSGATHVTMHGEIDGRMWVSKPDMMISALWLTKFEQRYRGRVVLVGDTLPQALRDKPDSFLQRLPTLVDHRGQPLPI